VQLLKLSQLERYNDAVALLERLGVQYPGATPLSITVKGKADSVPVHVLAAHP
jgi:hypothetical protein